ncbi:hypothetical protein J6590_093746 [Homalodisca vitripennis]|nr:hypothetical protein J6590_093746 [Homalodisca vitripennis]
MFAVEIEDFKAEYDNKLANFMSSNEVVDKIKTLEKEVDDGVKKLFTNLMSHIEKADKITEAIEAEKNYVSLANKKRIVGVRPGIDKHDVVVKEQILKPLKLSENINIVDLHDPNVKNALDFKGKRLSSVSKGIYPFDVIVKDQFEDHIKMFNELKQNYENHKQHVKDFTTEVYDKLEARNRRSVDDVDETAILGVGYLSDKCCILFNIPFIMELEGEIEEAQIVYEGVKDFYNNFAELKSYHEKSLKIINVLENKSLQEVERLKGIVKQMKCRSYGEMYDCMHFINCTVSGLTGMAGCHGCAGCSDGSSLKVLVCLRLGLLTVVVSCPHSFPEAQIEPICASGKECGQETTTVSRPNRRHTNTFTELPSEHPAQPWQPAIPGLLSTRPLTVPVHGSLGVLKPALGALSGVGES